MKEVFRDLIYELTNIALIAGATFLIFNDKGGWGWLLFALILNILTRKQE